MISAPNRADFQLLWVCRQVHEEVLSYIAAETPLDIKFEKWNGTLNDVLRSCVPSLYLSCVETVYLWNDNIAAKASVGLLPSLKRVVVRRRGYEPLEKMERSTKWTKRDVKSPDVTRALKKRSLGLLRLEQGWFNARFPDGSFEVVLKLRFGLFDVDVPGERTSDTPPMSPPEWVQIRGHTLVKPIVS